MRVEVIEPPESVITTDEAKAHLRVDGNDENALIDALIAAAQGNIDGPTGWLGRAIGVQTLCVYSDGFGRWPIQLPYPPAIEVEEIEYLDLSWNPQALSTDQYELLGDTIELAHGVSAWPQAPDRKMSVRVRYTAGYEDVPAPIRAAILLMVGDLYAARETFVVGSTQAVPMSVAVQSLLAPFRVYA